MANKEIIDDWYVRVEPIPTGLKKNYSDIEYIKKACEALIPEIKRHTDAGYISLESDSHWECEFCGSEMASKDDYGCCDKSEEEHEKTL